MAFGGHLPKSVQKDNPMAPRKRDHAPLGSHFIKEWREFKELRQEDVADEIGYDGGTISKIEDRKNPYTQRTLEALARLYETTPAALLSINPLEPKDEQLKDIISRIDGLTADNVNVLLAMAEGFQQANAGQPSQSLSRDRSAPASPRRVTEPSQ
jgi:transcriptional regulator with XRE-family HTH domain